MVSFKILVFHSSIENSYRQSELWSPNSHWERHYCRGAAPSIGISWSWNHSWFRAGNSQPLEAPFYKISVQSNLRQFDPFRCSPVSNSVPQLVRVEWGSFGWRLPSALGGWRSFSSPRAPLSHVLLSRKCFPCRVAITRRRFCSFTALTIDRECIYIILSDIFSTAQQTLSTVWWSTHWDEPVRAGSN